jgi:hypothetical protein
MSSPRIIGIWILTCFVAAQGFAQFDESPKRNIKYQLLGFGLISSFSNDTRITANTQAGMGAGAGLRMELPISRDHKDKDVRFCAGIEIMSEGLSFDSYYFSQGYSVLFDGNMAYNHSIRITSVCIPLLIRYSFTKKEESRKNYFYGAAGWEIKYIVQSHTTITANADGSLIYDGAIDLPFEHQFLGPFEGNDILASLGLNHNILPGKHAVVFDLSYRFGLSRNVYSGYENSNNVLFRGSNFSFGIGLRF